MALKPNSSIALQKLQDSLKKKDQELANMRRKLSRLEKKYRSLIREIQEAGFELDEEEEEELEEEIDEDAGEENEDDE